ncbi:hypothetical protein ASC74_22640 [Pseudomonas sp. Root329]|nr:hypothetical protein ASC74_22640 [Pseudomonas sp. Root329]
MNVFGFEAATIQASLMPRFFSVSAADLVKSRSMTGIIPVADAATETKRLPATQIVEVFKVGLPL